MVYKQLGNTTLKVSALGLGCMGMSEFYSYVDEKEALETLHFAYDSGINFYDTADLYGAGSNEELLKKFIKGRRNSLVVATKFGFVRGNGNSVNVNGKPDYVIRACEASLERLGTDYIDLYYLHRVDPSIQIENTIQAMAKLVKDGKVRFIGLSEVSASSIGCANKVHKISAVQTEYSVCSLDVEKEILPTCRDLNIAFIAYSPLGRGLLTGRLKGINSLSQNDFRLSLPRFTGTNLTHNARLVKTLETIARSKNCTPSQLALAWILKKGNQIFPIPGTSSKNHLLENIGSLSVSVSSEEIDMIERLSIYFIGERYHPNGMRLIDI